MRKIRAVTLALLFTLALVVSQASTANAAKSGSINGVGSVVIDGVLYDFNFAGSQVNKGGYTILDHANPKTRSLTGKASCFRLVDDYTAVISGPASYKNQKILGGGSFVLIVAQESVDPTQPDEIYIATSNEPFSCSADISGYNLIPVTGSIDVTP
jgi:hypothetical protein